EGGRHCVRITTSVCAETPGSQIQGPTSIEFAKQQPATGVVEGQCAAERLIAHRFVEPRGGLQLRPDRAVAQCGAAVVDLDGDVIVASGPRRQERPVRVEDVPAHRGTNADAVTPPWFDD